VLLVALFLLATLAGAQDFAFSAHELARAIGAKTGRLDVALTVRNASSLSEAGAAQVSRTLENELRVRPRPGVDRAVVNVTLSENAQSYLWVAEIRRGEEREVTLLKVARPSPPAAAPARLAIRKTLLWEQDTPILDAAVSDSLLIVLDTVGVSLHRDRETQSFSIPTRPLPRDARGRLTIDRDSFRAVLPGINCNGSLAPAAAMACVESSSELVPGRNYFTEARLPAYFSTATVDGKRLVAAIDGRTHIYDATLREVGQVAGWGSDIVAVQSECRAGVLASKPVDATETDAIQLYEMTDRGAAPVSDPAAFPGPVTALWPSARPGEAVAVARNLETGRYAAYSLAITCDR
jgi:hypothetical protein